MALQTFTVGQVLTAAQVTALQNDNYNQTVSTKTANHILVVADVGTRVYMNAAGSTTITVNTGIFAAGDTLFLGNIGAGSCVVTAGTATVSKFSTASLTLSQYQGAYLYFVSTGVAILYSDSAGASTPLTTKGDLFGFSTLNARVPIGTNNQVLVADSTEALGLKWATPASGGGMTLLSTTTLSSTSTTISIAGGYRDIQLRIKDGQMTSGSQWGIRLNSDTGTKYGQVGAQRQNTTVYTQGSTDSSWRSNGTAAANTNFQLVIEINDYLNTTTRVGTINSFYLPSAGDDNQFDFISFIDTTAITSITVIASAGNLSGTAYLIGVN